MERNQHFAMLFYIGLFLLILQIDYGKGIDIGTNNCALVLNTWNDFPLQNVSNVPAMSGQALQAYETLKSLGYKDENIVLMLYHPEEGYIDFDGDGLDDLAEAVIDVENSDINKTRFMLELEYIKLRVNGTDNMLVLYLIGHGSLTYSGDTLLTFENGENLSGEELNGWIEDVFCREILLLLDFCYSGGFANSITSDGIRLVMSSTDSEHMGYFYWYQSGGLSESDRNIFGDSGSVFFHPFWKEIREGSTIEDAFLYAKAMCTHWADLDLDGGNMARNQNPQIFEIAPQPKLTVYISKTSTSITPSSVYVNNTATLSVVVFNSGQNNTAVMLRVFAEDLIITPRENRSFVASEGSSIIHYKVKSTTRGTFIIEIELWCQKSKIDASTVKLTVSKPIEWRDLTSYEARLGLIYLISSFSILAAYIRPAAEQLKRPFWNTIMLLGFFWVILGGAALLSGALTDGLLLLLSPSLGRIETILAFSFILSISSWIFIYYKKTRHSLFVSNIIVFLMSLPVVFDWLLSPTLPFPETPVGKTLWQIFQTFLSVILGIILDRVLRGKTPSLKSLFRREP